MALDKAIQKETPFVFPCRFLRLVGKECVRCGGAELIHGSPEKKGTEQ